MNKFYLLVIALLITNICFAQTTQETTNTDTLNGGFEQFDAKTSLPKGWHILSHKGRQYRLSNDSVVKHSGTRSLLIVSADTASAANYAGLGYMLPARYIGKKVTVKAWMRTENMKGTVALMLGLYDVDGNTLQFENLQDKRMKGSKEWNNIV